MQKLENQKQNYLQLFNNKLKHKNNENKHF